MKKKLTLKLPASNNKGDNYQWPSQYAGQEVEVEVTGLDFPDGTCWCVRGPTYDAEFTKLSSASSPEARVEPFPTKGSPSLTDVLGFKPSRITIESVE